LRLDPHAISDRRIVPIPTAEDFAHQECAQQSMFDNMGGTHAALTQYRYRPILGAVKRI
jgi:hypothetical protein